MALNDNDKKWLLENFAGKKDLARLEKRLTTLEKGQAQLENGQAKLEKRMTTLEKGQKRLEKKLDIVANKLDKDNLATKQRVEKIESHLGISPPEF